MNVFHNINHEHPMNQFHDPMSFNTNPHRYRTLANDRLCAICGSKSVGMNFGVMTCAPCKAFFRRNARRKELLELPCRHRDLSALLLNAIEFNERSMRYLQIRRCSSCRLRRCFEMGMKEDLIRSEEENDRYKQLVEINRKRRDLLKQQLLEIHQLAIPKAIVNDNEFSKEIDWTHLSNIRYAYDTFCLKTFTQERATRVFNESSPVLENKATNKHSTSLTMSIYLAFSTFIKTLPAYYSLSRVTRTRLCKSNLRPIMFPNFHEFNQSCYAEPWQAAAYETIWEYICGPVLYEEFRQAKRLAEKLWINDPVVTRLWIIVLFFSTPLHYHDEGPLLTPILKKKEPLLQVQNAYVTLLWKYLVHRLGFMEAVRTYSNLIYVFLKMQRVGFGIYLQLRSQRDLLQTNETLNKLVALDINDDKKIPDSKETISA